MRFDRDAAPFVLAGAVPAGVAAVSGRSRLALSLLALPLAILAFFRDPDRAPDAGATTIQDPDMVLSPADGKVMSVGPSDPTDGPPGTWQQVVIFLSVSDVHINRAPYGGTVTDVTYRPGRFLAAFTPESGAENERSEITVVRELPNGSTRTVVFRQIVGIMARRVVTRVSAGDVIGTGQRIGLMKFGSRMDVFLPADVTVVVQEGQRVVAGETALGNWPWGSSRRARDADS